MDLTKILTELKEEKWAMEEAILSLERLALGHRKRRGRPPKWLHAARERKKGRGDSSSSPTDGRRRKTK